MVCAHIVNKNQKEYGATSVRALPLPFLLAYALYAPYAIYTAGNVLYQGMFTLSSCTPIPRERY